MAVAATTIAVVLAKITTAAAKLPHK